MSKIRKSSRAFNFEIPREDFKRVESMFSLFMNIDKRIRNANSSYAPAIANSYGKHGKATADRAKNKSKDKASKTNYAGTKARLAAGQFFGCDWIIRLMLQVVFMIDTIIITLAQHLYQISDPEKFTPSAAWTLTTTKRHHHGMKSHQNPSKKELAQGTYKPRLTLAYRRGITAGKELLLKIELSLPKLMYGNNFNELQYKDFTPVTEKLVAVLATMGVIVTAQALAQAPVMAIHYSKNIVLTDGSTPYHYIQKIKEANITQALDTNQTDYRNEGHSYRWHCNAYEVVFYDKIKDLEKAKLSRRRSLENDSELQMHLFNAFKNRKKLEFLRMEVRLNKRAKIKQLFKTLDISADLTFQKLFKPAIAKKVLLHYLDTLEQNRSPLSNFKTMTDQQFLAKLAVNNPDIAIKDALALFGFKKALETTTLRELKIMFGKHNHAAWNRFIKRSEMIKLPSRHTSFDVLREQLEAFRPVKLNIKTF